MHSLAVIINFCSTEAKFLPLCVKEANTFASQVIVPVADHFFNGIEEQEALLEKTFLQTDCQIVRYPYIKDLIKGKDKEHLWHSVSRLVGFFQVRKEIEYILFLDADEIVEGKAFLAWLNTKEYQKYEACRLWNFWYFREEIFQAKTWEASPVLVRKKNLSKKALFHKGERDAIFSFVKGNTKIGVPDKPLVHHYSWVRTQEEMLQKIASWGHKEDRNWQALVKKEFEKPFQGKDFVHGYEYRKVDPFFKRHSFVEKPYSEKKITEKELLFFLPGFFKKKIFSFF